MPKTKPSARSIDLTAAELYQMHRTILALGDLEEMLRKRWGARSATVLHLDALGADLDNAFASESSGPERAVIAKFYEAERFGRQAAQAGAVAEMNALPKPG